MTMAWDSLHERQALPARVHACSRLDITKYAAASGDFYPPHLDPDAPETRELGRLIVPGRFKHACLGRLVAEWAGRHGFVRRLLCRYGEADTVGRPLTCAGEVRRLVVDGEQRLVYLKIWVANAEGRITTLGTATVVWTGP